MMHFKNLFHKTNGQVLTVLLVFMAIAVTVISGAVAIILTNSQNTSRQEQGQIALLIAEAGMENALMRFLRDTSYVGEVLPVDSGTATVSVTGAITKTFLSVGRIGNFQKTIQVVVDTNNNVLTVVSWKEI